MKSRFLKIGLLVLLLLMLVLLGKQIRKRLEIRQEIRALEDQIREFEAKNQEFGELISYLQTPEFRERQARSLLNLQKPGEFAVALPGDPEAAQASGPADAGQKSNLIQWWDYFFAR